MDNQNAKKKFEDWCKERHDLLLAEVYSDEYSFEQFMSDIRAYALREAIDACTDENSKNNIENLI